MSGIWLVSYWVLWVLVLALVGIVVVLARQIGVLHMRFGPTGARTMNAGPGIGEHALETSALDMDGNPVRLGGAHEKPTLIMFISPNCPSCADVAPSIRAMAKIENSTLDILLVSIVNDKPKIQEFIAKHDLGSIPCVTSREVAIHYGVLAAPYGVLINQGGVVVSKGITNNMEHLESLLNAKELGQPSIQSWLKHQTSISSPEGAP
jgi:methylamine dehydrogenase accessory protein MauD